MTEEWFMLLLYCVQLPFNVWQRGGPFCGCYIVYHYCLRLDRGVVHVLVGYIVYHCCLWFDRGEVHFLVAILSTITVCGLTEEWYMLLLLYCLPLLFKVWQRGGSCCCGCYIVYHYCLRFDRRVVHVLAVYIVYHYCLRFDRWVVLVVVILSTITL